MIGGWVGGGGGGGGVTNDLISDGVVVSFGKHHGYRRRQGQR